MTCSGNGAAADETSGDDATTRLTAATVGTSAAGALPRQVMVLAGRRERRPAGRAGKAATRKPQAGAAATDGPP